MRVKTCVVGPLQENCYLLIDEQNQAIVVDPGDNPAKIIATLEQEQAVATKIILTHGHFDHIGAVEALANSYPDITIYIGAQELDVVHWSGRMLEKSGQNTVADYIINHNTLLEDGQTISQNELTITTMATPGHTQGGVVFLCQDVMFSGDTLFLEEVGRCDLYTGDFPTMQKTLKKLMALPTNYTVYPGHGPSSSLDHEKSHNPYMLELS